MKRNVLKMGWTPKPCLHPGIQLAKHHAWREGRRMKTTDDDNETDILCKIHVDRGRYHTIVPGIGPVTDVKRRPPTEVVDHTAEKVHFPPAARPAWGAVAGAGAGAGAVVPGGVPAGRGASTRQDRLFVDIRCHGGAARRRRRRRVSQVYVYL